MAGVCVLCETGFKPKPRGYCRHSLNILLNGDETIGSMLDSYGISIDAERERAFVCSLCYSQLKIIKEHESRLLHRMERKLDKALLVMFYGFYAPNFEEDEWAYWFGSVHLSSLVQGVSYA